MKCPSDTPLPLDAQSTSSEAYVLLTSTKLRWLAYVGADDIELRAVGGIINDFVAVKGFHSVCGEVDQSPTCSQSNVEVNRFKTRTRKTVAVVLNQA